MEVESSECMRAVIKNSIKYRPNKHIADAHNSADRYRRPYCERTRDGHWSILSFDPILGQISHWMNTKDINFLHLVYLHHSNLRSRDVYSRYARVLARYLVSTRGWAGYKGMRKMKLSSMKYPMYKKNILWSGLRVCNTRYFSVEKTARVEKPFWA